MPIVVFALSLACKNKRQRADCAWHAGRQRLLHGRHPRQQHVVFACLLYLQRIKRVSKFNTLAAQQTEQCRCIGCGQRALVLGSVCMCKQAGTNTIANNRRLT